LLLAIESTAKENNNKTGTESMMPSFLRGGALEEYCKKIIKSLSSIKKIVWQGPEISVEDSREKKANQVA